MTGTHHEMGKNVGCSGSTTEQKHEERGEVCHDRSFSLPVCSRTLAARNNRESEWKQPLYIRYLLFPEA